MTVQLFSVIGLSLIILTSLVGCSRSGGPATTRTTTTDRTPASPPADGRRVDVDVGPNGTVATGQGANGGVDVNVGPNGGVDIDVQGEPNRDRIQERRAARETALPR